MSTIPSGTTARSASAMEITVSSIQIIASHALIIGKALWTPVT